MILISNLHPNSDVNLLTELTDWEMRTVEGGRRRRSRRDDEDTSGALSRENVKETVNDWLSNIEQQIVDLRQQLTGLQ
ncbi:MULTISPECIES: hypothetical protein [unclassified Nostoc]|uniref:hypothetical protein n=1 Tax=unclassified Nostoc TaxID=2593658 RepID=UPI0013D703DB|nr:MULTISPECIES: hypothetical protein [unclassified Nostoc]MBE8999602.1 hypothetical protein [Nostoc sp. LEGE 12447]NEU78263.1 hypothetical protein [Nostoc sp. UIC 10630]